MSDFKTNLVQSADAAARVGVLFVAVAMFAAMWESDSPPSEATSDNWLARRAGEPETGAGRDRASERVSQSVFRRDTLPMLTPISYQAMNAQPYPMPAGIAAGEYRVVDSYGMTETLHVTDEMVSIQKSVESRDQYFIENGDRRIYFIRLQSSSVVARAQSRSNLN